MNLKNCENLRENSAKFEFLQKNLENLGKCETFDIIAIIDIMYSIESFSVKLLKENSKKPWKSQGKLREFNVFKLWSPC